MISPIHRLPLRSRTEGHAGPRPIAKVLTRSFRNGMNALSPLLGCVAPCESHHRSSVGKRGERSGELPADRKDSPHVRVPAERPNMGNWSKERTSPAQSTSFGWNAASPSALTTRIGWRTISTRRYIRWKTNAAITPPSLKKRSVFFAALELQLSCNGTLSRQSCRRNSSITPVRWETCCKQTR